ncbi:PRD domain-containing protein [Clostridium sediminicola]|uniref:PRD domain-containing protein n=1 Tax=Clostridium sediminicola TaxID=3114879 RepID=UPI0031F229FE
MLRDSFRVIKPFNHNVVFCISRNKKRECILIGKGIGFGVKNNQVIKNNKNIEKVFFLMEEHNIEKFSRMAEKVDANIVGVTEEVIALISRSFSQELNEMLHITLLDHINFALKRLKSNIQMKNPFLFEIKLLYKEEFLVAEQSLKIINEKLGVNLINDEVGFIAMHIHAALNNKSISNASLNTSIISDAVAYIEDTLGVTMNKDSLQYTRLIVHLRFAIDRAIKNINIKNLVLSDIKEKYKNSYDVSVNLAQKIKEEYFLDFPDGEIGYIAIHLENILSEIEKN